MHPIPSSKHNNVTSLLLAGHSPKKVVSMTGVSRPTVYRIAQTLELNKENQPMGRPPKLSPHNKRHIIHQIESGMMENAVEATKYINNILEDPVSPQTIRNALKKDHMKAVVKAKKPFLKKEHRRARLAFARKYEHWTVEDWKRVVWSDETKINRIGSDGRTYVWKRVGEPLSDRLTTPTVKHGGGSMMVWGCMGWNGVGLLTEVEGKMDAVQYVDILDGSLSKSVDLLEIPREEFIFQQDNDPKHTSRLATEWFTEQNIDLLDWPAQSPDLNPIEHLWEHLKKQIRQYPRQPTGIWELWERASLQWMFIDPEVCQRLIASMPRRLQAVIKANGGPTKY